EHLDELGLDLLRHVRLGVLDALRGGLTAGGEPVQEAHPARGEGDRDRGHDQADDRNGQHGSSKGRRSTRPRVYQRVTYLSPDDSRTMLYRKSPGGYRSVERRRRGAVRRVGEFAGLARSAQFTRRIYPAATKTDT